ncbi:MAG: hypothetical protein II147_05085 [Lachnospiraceae bacterium]|nr:hypothetical protein [Lachnospiraceae bacterium]
MMESNHTYDEEKTVDIMVLLVEVLRKIKPVLICALVFAVLLGGLSLAKGFRARLHANAILRNGGNLTVSEEAQNEYNAALKAYEKEIGNYENQIAVVKEKIKAKKEKCKDNYFLSTKPEEYYKESIIYYIDTHYTVNATSTVQQINPIASIMKAYSSLMMNDAFYSYLLANVSDLPEDFTTKEISRFVQLDTDTDRAFLTLSVCGKTKAQADKIFTLSKKYLEQSFGKISGSIAPFDITVVDMFGIDGDGINGTTVGVDSAWNAYRSEITALEAEITAIEDTMKTLIKPEEPEPEEVAVDGLVSYVALLKSSIKKGILGAFVGMFLACIYIALMFILKDYALSEEELKRRTGLEILASTKRFTGKGKWQKFLGRISGDDKRIEGVENAAKLAASNVASILIAANSDGETVFVVGHDRTSIEMVSSNLKTVKAIAGGDILLDTDVIDRLRDYTNVVIVESKESVSYGEIIRECDKLKVLNKNVLGIVAL